MKKILNLLVLLLAIISGLVAIGKLNDYACWWLICGYWIVLTIKNIIEYVAKKKEKKKEE